MKALTKNIFREIKNTKSRFFSILAIIALSTGFFSGVKASSPSMIETGRSYITDKNLMDIRLVSTVGFDDDDIKAIKEMEDTVDVMPGYSADLIRTENNIDSVIKVLSLPEKTDTNNKLINETILIDGRFPENDGECVIEDYFARTKGFGIGKEIIFNEKIQGNNTTDIIKQLNYKIVGIVNTPLFFTYQRGSTTVGDGTISFFIMLPSDQFVTERYTNVYVTTKASDPDIDPLTDEYKDIIKSQKDDYKLLADERIKVFNETTLADAKKELADAEKEFKEKKQEAEEKLADGEKKLHDGEQEMADKLSEGYKKIADAEKELNDGKEQLADGQKKYADGIEEAKNKLADAQTQYNDGLTKYTKGKLEYDTEISKAQAQLDKAQSEFDIQYSLFFGTTKPDAENKLNLMKTAIDICNEAIDKAEKRINELETAIEKYTEPPEEIDELHALIDEYREKINEYQKQYNSGIQQLSDGEQKLNEAKAQLDEAHNTFEQKKAEGLAKLTDAQIQLDTAKSQLDIGKLEYETALTTGMLEMQAAQTKISEGEKELEKGKAELENQKAEGLKQLKEAREKLATGKAEAKEKLGDAENKLNDAKDKIESLNDADWYIFERDDNPGYSGLVEDAQRVDNVAAVFPVFFLLIAALVCLTTMSRMVEERRTEIGTLKALGYSNFKIVSKYLVYSAVASVIGSAVGAVAGIFTLPFIILDTYSMMYCLPASKLVIDTSSLALSAGTGILCTCTVSVITCLGELRQKPASLMRPKAPKPGKRILLEYITPLWNNMNFTSKVTFRNIFRYKARFLMTVIGVAGCTALIIGGLGLKDSLSVIAPLQYEEITIFDQIYALKNEGTSQQQAYLMSQFHADKRFSETALVSQNWTTVSYNNDNNKINLRYIIAEKHDESEKFFILRDRITHEKVALDDSGIIINERLSQVTGITKGEMLNMTINDVPYSFKVSGITENYAGNYIYMTPSFYEENTGKKLKYNLVYTQLTEEGKKDERDIANDWMKKDEILTVSLIHEQLEGILSTLDSLDVIVLVLVICAAMLAVVVLYNLTNINISERVREIATIKVLGFYNMETANYIYRENIILTLTGALIGLPLGNVFVSFVVEAIQMDMVMFPKYVTPISFFYGFALTILFSLFVNFIMFFRMKKISMVESLKSIE